MESGRRQLIGKLLWPAILAALVYTNATADTATRAGMVGLSACWQQGQTDIMFPIWASDKMVITPSLSVVYASDIATDVGAALAVRFNQGWGEAVPYWGLRVGLMHRAPHEGKAMTDYLAGGMLGGECFLKDHFSVGLEAQVNAVFSDEQSFRYGNPNGTNVNTAAVIMATFYF